jgi:hypothetical protein
MRRSIIALGALVTMAGAVQLITPARAEIDYPVCRNFGGEGGGYSRRCDFTTLAQCQATASGIGGTCTMNPYYAGNSPANSNANASYRGRTRHLR